MNWLMYVVILQVLLGKVLSEFTWTSTATCMSQYKNNGDINEFRVECGSYELKATLYYDLKFTEIIIQCHSNQLPTFGRHFDQFNPSYLSFKNCELSGLKIHQAISTLGINKVEKLNLESIRINGRLENSYLSNLESVDELSITNTTLLLTNGSFEGIPNLKKLSLDENNIEEIPKGVFQQLKLLEELDLGGNNLTNIDSDLFDSIPLRTLKLNNNFLTTLNLTVQNLECLEVNSNKLTYLNLEALNAPKLKRLHLDHNKISKFTYNNIYLTINNINRIDRGWLNLTNLEIISLSFNNFTVIRLKDIQVINENVKTNTTLRLDLRYNPLESIDLTDLETFAKAKRPLKDTFNIQIQLYSEQFICDCRNYEVERYLHNQMTPIVYEYLNITTTILTCNDGLRTEFKNVNMDSLTTCDWNIFEDEDKTDCMRECECSYHPYDKSASMNCANRNLTLAPETIISSRNLNFVELNLNNNSITKLPNYEHFKIRKLNIGYNNFNTINITQLPKSLTELHLEHNNITTIIEMYDLNNTLTNIGNITMSSNPWMCDCDDMNTLNFIRKYSSKIFDVSKIMCLQPHIILNKDYANFTTEKLCEQKLNTDETFSVSIVFAVLSLVLLIILLVIMYFNYSVRVWLYCHNITWLTPSPFPLNTSLPNVERTTRRGENPIPMSDHPAEHEALNQSISTR